jgi:hypothetical protein
MKRSVLTLLALAGIGLAALGTSVPPRVRVAPAKSDFETFRSVVARVRVGEPYYQSMGTELRARGYPTSRAFNWRTPFHVLVLAVVPDIAGRAGLIALLLALCGATMSVVRRPWAVAWVTSAAYQTGVLLIFAAPALVLLSETWAGVLVGLSACLYGLGRTRSGFAAGLLALFVRELAAPYCVAAALFAVYNRRWQEVAAWTLGACAYAVYYALHLAQVWSAQLPGDTGRESTWLAFGGLPFLLATIRWTGWPYILPDFAVAVTLVLVAGCIGSARAPYHVRAASAVYAAFFLLAGQPFNHYWGLMAAPSWAVASGYGAESIAQAFRTVAKRGDFSE